MFNIIGSLITGVVTGWLVNLMAPINASKQVRLPILVGGLGGVATGTAWSIWVRDPFGVSTILAAFLGSVGLLAVIHLLRRSGTRTEDVRITPSAPASLTDLEAMMRWGNEGGAADRLVPVPSASLAENQNGSKGVAVQPQRYSSYYRAVVTAHFPGPASGARALQALSAMALSPSAQTVQYFDGNPAQSPIADHPSPSTGEKPSMLIQIADATRGVEIMELCKRAGATFTTFYPARSVVKRVK